MAENNQEKISPKSPAVAAFLSMIPGVGALYLGNIAKGIAYMIIFAGLIVLTSHASVTDSVVFGLLIGGFYIFQIIDSVNDARKQAARSAATALDTEGEKEEMSLFTSVFILVLGILFLLANFDVITFRQIARLWPLLLISIGLNIIFRYFKKESDNERS